MIPADATPTSLPYSSPQFVSAHGRARATAVLLWIGIAIHLISIPIDVIGIILPEANPNQDNSDNLAGLFALVSKGLLGLLSAGVYLATAIIFLMWLYRAYSNLPALGAQRRSIGYSPGWAVGSFFVPFANLVIPYRAIKELWQKSQPPSEEALFSSSISPPGIFPVWWGFWLASNFAGNIYFRINADGVSREVIFSLGVTVDALSIIAGWLATMVVKEIDERQTQAASQIPPRHFGPLPPPPPMFSSPNVLTDQTNSIPNGV